LESQAVLDPASTFSLAGLAAIAGWLGLLVSLFVVAARPPALMAARFIIPALLALAYALLIAEGMGQAEGGFGSIPEVRALFANDSALAAGWLHYLAFDLFVGAWIAEQGLDAHLSRWLLIPCFALTFLFGPIGLLLFFALRLATRHPAPEKSS
jgi:hypothetical protein